MLLPEDEVIVGYIGGKIEFEIALTDENDRPIDSTNYAKFRVCIPITKTTSLEVSETASANGSIMQKVGDARLGVFKVSIVPLDSATLLKGEGINIDFEMSNVGDPNDIIRYKIERRLTLKDSVCA